MYMMFYWLHLLQSLPNFQEIHKVCSLQTKKISAKVVQQFLYLEENTIQYIINHILAQIDC